MWVAASETGEMRLDKLSMTSYVYRTYKGMGSATKSPELRLQGSFIAAFLAQDILNKNQQEDSSESSLTQEGAMTVWVTNNYALDEAMDTLIGKAFVNGDTATLFFNKPIESLSLPENLILGAYFNRTDLGEFCDHEVELAAQAEKLLQQLKENFPPGYDAQVFEAPEYSEALKAECAAQM